MKTHIMTQLLGNELDQLVQSTRCKVAICRFLCVTDTHGARYGSGYTLGSGTQPSQNSLSLRIMGSTEMRFSRCTIYIPFGISHNINKTIVFIFSLIKQ